MPDAADKTRIEMRLLALLALEKEAHNLHELADRLEDACKIHSGIPVRDVQRALADAVHRITKLIEDPGTDPAIATDEK